MSFKFLRETPGLRAVTGNAINCGGKYGAYRASPRLGVPARHIDADNAPAARNCITYFPDGAQPMI
jgi:hypothetical protein